MKVRLLLSVVAWGLLAASLMLLSTSAAHAQCGPNLDEPCEKERKATPTSPPATPTSTPPVCTESAWYRDADLDGYGAPGTAKYACAAPAGYAVLASDCNDANAAIRPGAADICGDGIDQDCDGTDLTCGSVPPGGAPEPPDPAGIDPPPGTDLRSLPATAFLAAGAVVLAVILWIFGRNRLGRTTLERSRTSAMSKPQEGGSLRTVVSSQAMFYQGDVERDETYDYTLGAERIDTPAVGGPELELRNDHASQAEPEQDSSAPDDESEPKQDQDD